MKVSDILRVKGGTLYTVSPEESLATGLELGYLGGLLALRTGYNFMADEMGLAAGFGANFMLGSAMAGLDYAFTDGNSLGGIHRWAIRVDF